MGVFDTFSGRVTCSHCGEKNRADIQFKWLDPWMHTYVVGDYVDGNEAFSVLDQDPQVCNHCDNPFTAFAIGRLGYLYGFCNEKELTELKTFLPLGQDASHVTFTVSKDLLELSPEETFVRLHELYAKQPDETNFLLTAKETDEKRLEQLVCRLPDFVKDPNKRPAIGEYWYIDNRESVYREWNLKDKKGNIISRTFRTVTQDFLYNLQMEDGTVLEEIPEEKLVDEDKRKEILDMLNLAKREILSFYEATQNVQDETIEKTLRRNRLRMELHYRYLIEDMKRSGELPQSFALSE